MTTVADNFLKDGAFGRRVLALLASFYAIALLYGRSSAVDAPRAGYEVMADALRSVGLDAVADWLSGTLMEALGTSPALPLAGALVLVASALSMAATFRRTTFNISPQASFAYLLVLCLHMDLGQFSLRTAVITTVAMGVVVGLFGLLTRDHRVTHPAVVALLMMLAPWAAVLYGPAKALNWLATESPRQPVPVAVEAGTEPVQVEIVDRPAPQGSRVV